MKFIYVLLAALGASSLCCAEDAITAETALHNYENGLKSIRQISFHSEFWDRLEVSPVFTNRLSQTWKIDFAGKRLWRTTGKDDDARTTYDEQLITPAAIWQFSVDKKTAAPDGLTAYLKVPADYWVSHTGFLYLSFPFGYMEDARDNNKYIPDLLRNPTLAKEGEIIVLASKTDEYELSVWLNPAKRWLAERIEYRRTLKIKDSIRPDYCSYRVERASNYHGTWVPEFFHCKISHPAGKDLLPPNIRIVDGAIIMVADENSKIGTRLRDEPKSVLVAEVTLSEISTNFLPDAEFELRTKIPDGTEVSMQDAHQSRFEWRGGKIVPRGIKR